MARYLSSYLCISISALPAEASKALDSSCILKSRSTAPPPPIEIFFLLLYLPDSNDIFRYCFKNIFTKPQFLSVFKFSAFQKFQTLLSASKTEIQKHLFGVTSGASVSTTKNAKEFETFYINIILFRPHYSYPCSS